MDEDDLEPRAKPPAPKNLEPLSIEALDDYIAELEAEIRRVRAETDAKKSHRGEAESLFRN